MSDRERDDDDPEVIKARADAEVKVLEARAKLSSSAQVVYAIFDSIGRILNIVFYFILALVVLLACVAPQLLPRIFGQ